MSAWKLNINGVESTLQALGIATVGLDFRNLAIDGMALTEAPGSLNGTPPLVYGDTVKLIQDTTTRFIGSVITSPKTGLPADTEIRNYQASNVFHDLNRMIYEQEWSENDTSTYFKGRVVLGKDKLGARISIGAAIKDVLDFAINEGLSFTYTSTDLDALTVEPPDGESVDIMCFEAIKSLLQWAPSVATEVEYSTGTPNIRFVQRASATAVSYNSGDLVHLDITPRNDIKVDGVIIKYEILNQVDGKTWTKVSQDTAGVTTGLNVLKQTIDLYGMNATSTEQQAKVVVSAVPSIDQTFFETYIPALLGVTDLVVTGGTGSGLPNLLIEGTVPEWTEKTTSTTIFSAVFEGKIDGCFVEKVPIAVELTTTNATSTTYKQLSSSTYTAPEDIPVGLAAKLFAERSVLHYSGALSITDDEPDWTASTANTINILPGTSSSTGVDGLSTIAAVVESIQILITPDIVTTNVSIGPPRHLQAQDYIALSRASRTRVTSSWSRKDPAEEGDPDGAVKNGGLSPNNNGAGLSAGLPGSPLSKQVLTVDLTNKPEWKDHTLIPEGTENGDLLFWDTSADPEWATIALNATDGYRLVTTGTALAWKQPLYNISGSESTDLVLTSDGSGSATWETSTGLPASTAGDLLYGNATGGWAKLALGLTVGYRLAITATGVEWEPPELPSSPTEGDFVVMGSTIWESQSLATALGLTGTNGIVYWNGTSLSVITESDVATEYLDGTLEWSVPPSA